MGLRQCASDHSFVTRQVGAGLQRLECERCSAVVLDLVESEEQTTSVTEPGLFKKSGPTIFSVLGEEQRAYDPPPPEEHEHTGPRYAFGGSSRR